MRNFGLSHGPASSGVQRLPARSPRADTLRDLYPYPEYPLHSDAPEDSPSDRDFGAFCFALFGLSCPFAIVGVLVTGYLLLFR